jgi:hypothetical protein
MNFGVLAIVEENGLEEILVGVCRLLGETQAGLLSSSGLIDLLSPNIQEVVMLLRGYSSCLLDDHSGSPPLSHIASGKNFPFPNRSFMTPSGLRTVNGAPAHQNNV